ncbi:MAG: hypothetical protein KKC20_03440 [Proteobacteria bacterium]|nr:hypothetical protein [Pseudomonadota bacterium]
MSLMTRFQQRKKTDPEYGNEPEGKFQVIGTMPGSAIGKQQAMGKMEAELENDLAALKLIKSIKEKERVKAESLVPKYLPVVNGLCASGSAHPLLGQILVWLFDIKDIPAAMDLAVHCIAHEVPMPERFKRDLPDYLCDTIVEWAEAEFEADRSCEPYFSQVCDLAKDWDVPDQVRAKLYRLSGMIAVKNEDWKVAVVQLEYATEYGAKVKTLLAQAHKELEGPQN